MKAEAGQEEEALISCESSRRSKKSLNTKAETPLRHPHHLPFGDHLIFTGPAMELWMVGSVLVLVILQGTAARVPRDASSAVAQDDTVLATCTAASSQAPVELAWVLGSLENTTTTITVPPENPTALATVTSYLIGAVPPDGQQRAVQCVITRPNLEGEKIISYTLDSTMCSLEPQTQSPVFHWTEEEEVLLGEALALASKVDEKGLSINCTYGQVQMGEKVALAFVAVVGGLSVLAMICLCVLKMCDKL
ncbi:hypothetical protein ACEWY4_027568 [Coilia grayii]|uniref:CD80-like immunoglobulin C2-set domain-containing protein n=1 Tax=Coilia grayii TaxID=363190 RepID=A0ABD1IQE0_9TELE